LTTRTTPIPKCTNDINTYTVTNTMYKKNTQKYTGHINNTKISKEPENSNMGDKPKKEEKITIVSETKSRNFQKRKTESKS